MKKCFNGGKVCYHDKREAKEARKTLKYKLGWKDVTIYRCPYCKNYYLTNSKY